MKHALRIAVPMRVPLPVEHPTLVALVNDRLELPRTFATIPSHTHAAREPASREPEGSDLSSERRDVGLGQDSIETHLISVADPQRAAWFPLPDRLPGVLVRTPHPVSPRGEADK